MSSARGLEVESGQSEWTGYYSMLRAEVQQNGHVRLAMEHVQTGKAVTGKLNALDHWPSTPAGQTS